MPRDSQRLSTRNSNLQCNATMSAWRTIQSPSSMRPLAGCNRLLRSAAWIFRIANAAPFLWTAPRPSTASPMLAVVPWGSSVLDGTFHDVAWFWVSLCYLCLLSKVLSFCLLYRLYSNSIGSWWMRFARSEFCFNIHCSNKAVCSCLWRAWMAASKIWAWPLPWPVQLQPFELVWWVRQGLRNTAHCWGYLADNQSNLFLVLLHWFRLLLSRSAWWKFQGCDASKSTGPSKSIKQRVPNSAMGVQGLQTHKLHPWHWSDDLRWIGDAPRVGWSREGSHGFAEWVFEAIRRPVG